MVLAIETWELTKRFNGVTVVDGLNLAVPEGSVFGLVGAERGGQDHHHQDVAGTAAADEGKCMGTGP